MMEKPELTDDLSVVQSVRILEIPDCKMVSSGACKIFDDTFNRFDQWMSSQKRRIHPADFLYGDGTWFHWLYLAEFAENIPSEFEVVDFHGGLYAVATGFNQNTDMAALHSKIDEFLVKHGFQRDPDRPGLCNVITPPAAQNVMKCGQMDYYFPICAKECVLTAPRSDE